MNAAQMGEALLSRYPNRFCIPSETEIKQKISSIFVTLKCSTRRNKRKTNEDNSIYVEMAEVAIDWANTLEEIMSTNRTEKPEIIYNDFVMLITHNIPFDDLPSKENVKQKILYFKQKYKKMAVKDVV